MPSNERNLPSVKTPLLLAAALAATLTWGCGGGSDGAPAGTGGSSAPATGGAGTGGTAVGGAGTGGTTAGGAATGGDGGAAGPWSMGYYASWQASMYPVSAIEWSGLTQIAVAFYVPEADGSLTLLGENPEVAAAIVEAAHAQGVRALASIGGADSAPAFRAAMTAEVQPAFVASLITLLDDLGYDGLDIDWEPLDASDHAAVVEIATAVRAERPAALLTIPIGCVNVNLAEDLTGYAAIAEAYAQLNLMSYGQAGAWEGWESWHSSALYHTSSATPLSIDSSVDLYIAAGVPVGKLGLGIGFYGLCYSEPVTGPAQPLNGATVLAGDTTMSYANIMTHYYAESARQWDDLAKVPYLSFGSPQAPDGCTYITYDDEESIAEKGAYLRTKGLGGVIQWELNEAYLADAPDGQRNPLLTAIHDHILN